MPILLEDKNRDYQRLRHTAAEKIQLISKGLQHVLSSNVSAVSVDGNDLIVRFHGGRTYRYDNQAKLYEKMLKSNSKGKFVWRNLRKADISYQEESEIPIETELDIQEIQEVTEKILNVTDIVGATTLGTITDDKTGLNFGLVKIGELILHKLQ